MLNPTLLRVGDSQIGYLSPDPSVEFPLAKFGLLAMACAMHMLGPIGILQETIPTAHLGVRGQTITGSRIGGQERGSLDTYLEDIDAVAMDFGKSTNRLQKFRSELGSGKRSALFGYSHAGYFATAYALRNPSALSALVLVEPALINDPDELRSRVEKSGAGGVRQMLEYISPDLERGTSGKYADHILEAWESPESMGQEWLVRADNPISEEALSKIEIPTLVIGGTKSNVSFMAERAAAAIPHAACWWVRGADHLGLMSVDHAEELAAVIDVFLTSATR